MEGKKFNKVEEEVEVGTKKEDEAEINCSNIKLIIGEHSNVVV